MKKILLVIPTLNQGGAERVISELANYWSEKDMNIHVAILVKSEYFYVLNKNITTHDIGNRITNKFNKLSSIIKTYIKLRSLIKNNSFDFIISFLPQSNVLTLAAAIGLKEKIYVSERNSPSTWNHHNKLFIYIRDYLYSYAEGFIAQTNDAEKALKIKYPNSKIAVIPNPIKKITFDLNIRKENIILNVGRLDKQKGQIDLIEAFHDANLEDWKLVILGEGQLRKILENKIIELNLKEKVLMPGAVSDIDEWYQKSSIFAFTSYFEGFPNALIEAMASGLPSISYDCDTGPRDIIINEENGFLTNVGDIKTFSLHIKKLVINKKLRKQISLEALKISDKYSIDNISNLILNLINKGKT